MYCQRIFQLLYLPQFMFTALPTLFPIPPPRKSCQRKAKQILRHKYTSSEVLIWWSLALETFIPHTHLSNVTTRTVSNNFSIFPKTNNPTFTPTSHGEKGASQLLSVALVFFIPCKAISFSVHMFKQVQQHECFPGETVWKCGLHLPLNPLPPDSQLFTQPFTTVNSFDFRCGSTTCRKNHSFSSITWPLKQWYQMSAPL